MVSPLAGAIRRARVASGFTQVQLGRRVGLKGRAVYRWERGDSEPRRRHRRELLVVLNAVNPTAAAELASAFEAAAKPRSPAASPTPAPASPAPPDPKLMLDLAILALADELDVSPRRLRVALSKLLQRVREQQLNLPQVEQHLVSWLASPPPQ